MRNLLRAVIVATVLALAGLAFSQFETGAYRGVGADGFAQSLSSTAPVVKIVGQGSLTVALRADGSISAWGSGLNNEFAFPQDEADFKDIAVGTINIIAIRNDGSVVVWGDNTYGQCNVPAGLTGVVEIAAGDAACVALKSDGTVVGWGLGQAPKIPAGLSNVTAISVDGESCLAVKTDGTVVKWGISGPLPTNLTNVKQVATATDFNLALLNDGTVVQWSDGTLVGALPAGLSGVTQIAADGSSAAALLSDGKVVTWGRSHPQIPTAWPPMASICVENQGVVYGLTKSGQLYKTDVLNVPLPPSNLFDVTQISAGNEVILGLRSNGTVTNFNTFATSYNPSVGLTGVVQLVTTSGAAIALKSDGTVVGWGSAGYGAMVPMGLKDVIQLAAGYEQVLALKKDGTVVGWSTSGYNDGNGPTGLANVVQVDCGYEWSAALLKDGSVVAWGDNSEGQCNTVGLNFTKISLGSYYGIGQKTDGTLQIWGQNDTLTQPPVGITNPLKVNAAQDANALLSNRTAQFWGVNPNYSSSLPGLIDIQSYKWGPSADVLTQAVAVKTGIEYFQAGVGGTTSVSVFLPHAPAAAVSVPLSSDDPNLIVPSTVSFAAGQHLASVTATVSPMLSAGTHVIKSTYLGASVGAGIVSEQDNLGLVLYTSQVVGGNGTKGIIHLNQLAPPLGIKVAISASDPTIIVPAYVMIQGGSSSATFSINSQAVTADDKGAVTISIPGSSATSNITIKAPVVSALSLYAHSVEGGTPTSGVVTLNVAAPTQGATVLLSSSDPAVIVPPSVSLTSGKTTTVFPVSTTAVTVVHTVMVTASLNGVTKQVLLTVKP